MTTDEMKIALDLALLHNSTYSLWDNKDSLPDLANGWELAGHSDENYSGFFGAAYFNLEYRSIAIIYSGTSCFKNGNSNPFSWEFSRIIDCARDIYADIGIFFGIPPYSQIEDAISFTNNVISIFPTHQDLRYKLYFSGHSLGTAFPEIAACHALNINGNIQPVIINYENVASVAMINSYLTKGQQTKQTISQLTYQSAHNFINSLVDTSGVVKYLGTPNNSSSLIHKVYSSFIDHSIIEIIDALKEGKVYDTPITTFKSLYHNIFVSLVSNTNDNTSDDDIINSEIALVQFQETNYTTTEYPEAPKEFMGSLLPEIGEPTWNQNDFYEILLKLMVI
jgi:hypothetical protein